MTEQNKVLVRFACFILWVESLKGVENDLWLKPLAEGKWSIREILTHIVKWDKNSLEMVPDMKEGAELSFTDIESLNAEASACANKYTDIHSLVDDVIQARLELIGLLQQQQYDESARFTIDGQHYTIQRFVQDFIDHDDHHREQIEQFLINVL